MYGGWVVGRFVYLGRVVGALPEQFVHRMESNELTLSRVLVKSSMLTVTMASFALESSLRDMLIKGTGGMSKLTSESKRRGRGW